MFATSGLLRRTLAAFALFSTVEFAYWVAVLLYAYEVGGPAVAGVALLAQLLPAALLATPLGAVADRFRLGSALSGAYALEAVSLVGLTVLVVAAAPLPIVVACSAITTVLVSVARPLHHAALPQLSGTPNALVRANAATGTCEGVGVFIGPIIAGALSAAFGYGAVTMLCAAAMVLAALLTVRLGLPASRELDEHPDGDGNWLDGVRTVAKDRAVFALLLLIGVAYVVVGTLELMCVALAVDVLGGDDSTGGLLIGMFGIGTFLGSLAAGGLAARSRLTPLVAAMFLCAGVPLIIIAMVIGMVPAVLLLIASGIGIAVSAVAGRTLLHRTTEARLLARVFAVQESVMILGLAIGAVLGPLLITWLGASGAFAPVGVALAALGAVTIPLLRGLDQRVVLRPDVVRALRGVGFLSSMGPVPMTQLARSATWLDVPEDTVVIRQGDRGDAFYVVGSGRLSVTKDGELLGSVMEPGDGFGELALLRDAPRAATITALEPCRLLRIERDDFLAAMTGRGDGGEIARQVAAAFDARARAAASIDTITP